MTTRFRGSSFDPKAVAQPMSGRKDKGERETAKPSVLTGIAVSPKRLFDGTRDDTPRVAVKAFEAEYFSKAYGATYFRRNPPEKLGYYLDRIREVQPNGSLLDIGCAYGLFAHLAARYFRVMGCDVSAHALEHAHDRYPDIPFAQLGVENLSFEDAFDVVTCFDVLEHVSDLPHALQNIYRSLKRGGIIALTVPVYDTLAGALVGFLDRDHTHVWKESREFWKVSLRSSGFEIMRNIGLWRYLLFDSRYIFFGSVFWRNFSPAILLIGEKR